MQKYDETSEYRIILQILLKPHNAIFPNYFSPNHLKLIDNLLAKYP
jgi:hypothetical protein